MSLKDMLNQDPIDHVDSVDVVDVVDAVDAVDSIDAVVKNHTNETIIDVKPTITKQPIIKEVEIQSDKHLPLPSNGKKSFKNINDFKKHLKVLQKIDSNEHLLQDWNFLSLQELELITIWNNQIKEILEEDSENSTTSSRSTTINRGLSNLIENMDQVNNEWKLYKEYTDKKDDLIDEKSNELISKYMPGVDKKLKELEKQKEKELERERKLKRDKDMDLDLDMDSEVDLDLNSDAENTISSPKSSSLSSPNKENKLTVESLSSYFQPSSSSSSSKKNGSKSNKSGQNNQHNAKEILIKPKKRKLNGAGSGIKVRGAENNTTSLSSKLKDNINKRLRERNRPGSQAANISSNNQKTRSGRSRKSAKKTYDDSLLDEEEENGEVGVDEDMDGMEDSILEHGEDELEEDDSEGEEEEEEEEDEDREEESDDDEEDDEDEEDGESSHPGRKRNGGRPVVTPEEKTRMSIMRMVHKSKKKVGEERKRRFTQCVVSDFDEKEKKVEIKITLKQHHVKVYRRHIREKEQAKKREEKQRLAAELKAAQQAKLLSSKKQNKGKSANDGDENDSTNITGATSSTGRGSNRNRSNKDDDAEDDEDEEDEEEDEEGGEKDENGQLIEKAKIPLDTTNNHFENENLPRYGLKMTAREARAIQRHYDNTYFAIWKDLARKDSNKYSKTLQQMQQTRNQNTRKTASLVAREARKWQSKNLKQMRDIQVRARRGIREMSQYWKRNERDEKELKKKREKEMLENAKREEEEKEKQRQAKQLEFLLTKSEMVSHFIAKKVKTSQHEKAHNSATNLDALDEEDDNDGRPNIELDLSGDVKEQTQLHEIDFENENQESLDKRALENASNALKKQQRSVQSYDYNEDAQDELNFQNPSTLGDSTLEQPQMLACTLKEYQLNGLRWLNSIYSMGMNGILADEMGLGKTVQSISMLTNLAENHNIWGPFLVVTPASTLHNWVQEISKFVPDFKILPYWGNGNDRKILRRFWDRKHLRYDKDSPFHVMITSYQMVVSDAAYLQKMKWQYMILDEAQAIKSAQSLRWKNLLSFHCRNRLLLTGTPIQNNMEELWALLHFIMPDYFNSIDDFNAWFNKDSKDGSINGMNTDHLNRLHDILKPFMLRRIKKNVQSELGDKIEIDVMCDLTQRQSKLYRSLKSQMSRNYDDIEKAAIGAATSATSSSDSGSSGDSKLINAVMEFRKVCNHPYLFERADVNSPLLFGTFGNMTSLISEKDDLELSYSSKNRISFDVPKLIYDDLILPNFESNHVDVKNHILNEKLNVLNANSDNIKNLLFLCVLSGVKNPNELKKLSKSQLLERTIKLLENPSEVNSRLELLLDQDNRSSLSRTNLLIPQKFETLNTLKSALSSNVLSDLLTVRENFYNDHYLKNLKPAFSAVVTAPPIVPNVYGRNSIQNTLGNTLFNKDITQAFSDIPSKVQKNLIVEKKVSIEELPRSELWPEPLNKNFSTRHISMPSMDRFITDSAKLKQLDQLLVKLKEEDHRVLVYFQMTKMMDLMEDYLTYRQYKHIRLDGSSKLEDRRDLVHDWQTKPEIFIFLLSTRAGGLGINLTAADTVIFYDSDWNPTIDSQAMDRAHRLGQKKQVTVYRLVCRDTIEERMRDTAIKKEKVQKVVMEGKKKQKQLPEPELENSNDEKISEEKSVEQESSLS